MPKYMLQASYTTEGLRGLLKDGGSKRKTAASVAIESVGGKLEAFYFAFGETDAFAIIDVPDNVSASAAALATAASGAVQIKTVALLTPEEVDDAARKKVAYSPPGA